MGAAALSPCALKRREAMALSLLPMLGACGRDARPVAERLAARLPELDGGWVGASVPRGHRLREVRPAPSTASTRAGPPDGFSAAGAKARRAQVLILGAGISGLACARELRRGGIDVALLDLEDQPGGNSRGHRIGALDCPLGAHYLPVPGAQAPEVQALLEELGLARRVHGRWVHDERHLCHSPQERLWWQDHWVEGLLPPASSDEELAQYRRFGDRVTMLRRTLGFAMPALRAPWTDGHRALDAMTFAQWLDSEALTAAPLRWYLDYCCRDDYGADATQVSAWAGLHYFGSRHGFMSQEDREAVLTWPQGNGWLSARLAEPLADAFFGGRTVMRLRENRHDVQVLAWNEQMQSPELWVADQVVLALPLFVAARLPEQPASALRVAASALRYAPWLVANVAMDRLPLERLGAPLAWDNVTYGGEALGYVHAGHQSLSPVQDAAVFTAYRALPQAQRHSLLDVDWRAWAAPVLADLAALHPDLPERVQRVDLMRYGHAMCIPRPGVRSSPALAALRERAVGRLHVAHSDVAGYSVFEEAFIQGASVARRVSRQRAR